MRNLVLAIAAILALNVLFGLGIAISELRSRRKMRREIGVLESILQQGSRVAPGRWRARLASRTTSVAAAVAVLSGVAVAVPETREAVVSTLTSVVGMDDGAVEASGSHGADSRADAGASPGDAPAARSSERDRRNGDRAGSPAGAARDDSPPADAPAPTEQPSPSPVAEPSESPDPPIGAFIVDAEGISSTAIVVTWTPLSSATGYTVERSPDGVSGWVDVGADAMAGSATIDGLDPGTTYFFRVTATFDTGVPVIVETSAATLTAPAAE